MIKRKEELQIFKFLNFSQVIYWVGSLFFWIYFWSLNKLDQNIPQKIPEQISLFLEIQIWTSYHLCNVYRSLAYYPCKYCSTLSVVLCGSGKLSLLVLISLYESCDCIAYLVESFEAQIKNIICKSFLLLSDFCQSKLLSNIIFYGEFSILYKYMYMWLGRKNIVGRKEKKYNIFLSIKNVAHIFKLSRMYSFQI